MVSRRRFSFGTFCPEVSAGDEIPQGELGRVQLVHQPLSDGGNAKGRNEERKDEEHNPARRLPTNEQDDGEQRQHNAAHLTHGGRHAEQECNHSGKQGQRHHYGGGKDFENDHSSYLHKKIGLFFPSTHIIPLGKQIHKDVDFLRIMSKLTFEKEYNKIKIDFSLGGVIYGY